MIDPVDPKLKDAIKEVQAVLIKYDIAGAVYLCSGERSEYMLHIFNGPKIGPTWSCIVPEKDGLRIRAKASRDHKERWRLNLTVKMVHTIRELLVMQFGVFDRICETLANHIKIEHGESGHLSHEDWQNR